MDIVEQMRSFEIDHEPDGWPAVQMKQISALCDEIERLQSVIDEANAQGPLKWALDHFALGVGSTLFDSEKDAVDFSTNLAGSSRAIPLYARPIPAQQSPAAAVPDDDLIKQVRDIWWNAKSAHVMREDTAIEIINLVLAQSPRITEQDAYDIILNFYWYMEEFKNKHGRNPSLIDWRDAEGRALLDKLNGAKNAQ